MKALVVTSLFLFLSSIVSAQAPIAWSQSGTYSSGDLVIDGITTYKALQDVPANTAISNTSYWATLDSQVPSETPSGADSLTAPDATEVENLTVPDTNSSSSSSTKFLGISTRGPISSSKGLTPGIFINGSDSKRVAIMAKGYTMNVTDGVTTYADDLKMIIYSWNTTTSSWDVTGTYDDYGDVTQGTTANGILVENLSSINLTDNPDIVMPESTKEAGAVFTLPPGKHAAFVTSKKFNSFRRFG